MLLESESALEVVGEAEDSSEVRAIADSAQPTIVLLDLSTPDHEGRAAIAGNRASYPRTKLLVLTLLDDAATRAAVKESGADALIAKHSADEILLPTIHRVALRSRWPQRESTCSGNGEIER
jgi:DNA-binding NarL/FixJ family response regulator